MSTKTAVDHIIDASWIIPIVPRDRILSDCSLAIKGETIVDFGIRHNIHEKYDAASTHSLEGMALLPGFINAHGHAAMSLFRGYADDKPLMDWLQNYIWPAEQRFVCESFVKDGTELAIAEMLLAGTTCFSDMYFFPEACASVALDAGIRAQITFPILDFPTAWGSGPDEYLKKGIALHDQYRSQDLINVGFGPHAPYTVSDEPLKRIATYAEELQAPVQIHLHETAHEVEEALAANGERPIERLSKLGVLSPLTQCVHMTQLNDDDIAILKSSGASVIHCPESNMKLASGACPVPTLLENNITVALGTDGAASNNDLDISSEMQTAALLAKLSSGDAAAVSAMQSLEMATINGAKALGLESQIGSIEIGKKADLIAIDLSGIEQLPLHNPISHIAYTAISHRVSHVWINGEQLVKNRKLLSLDKNSISERVLHWQKQMETNNN